jgi:NADPH:quinone reductase-like Zn-dependent oxidoreductase
MTVPRAMEAIRLHAPGVDGLRPGEVLVEVHAAAITRDDSSGRSTDCRRFRRTGCPVWR